MTKAKYYLYLRGKLKERSLTVDDLAAVIGKNRLYVESRLSGRSPWTAEDRVLIMEELGEPEINFYLLFPRNGIGNSFTRQAAGIRAGKLAGSGRQK